MAAVASMSAALAVTHQLRRGTGGGDYAVCSGCSDVQDCGNVATIPTAAPAAATLLAAAQVAPYNPMYNPLYGMEACGAGYKYRYRTPQTDHPTRSCSRSELSYNVIPIPRPVMPLQPWVSGAANEAYEIPVHVETRGHEFEALSHSSRAK